VLSSLALLARLSVVPSEPWSKGRGLRAGNTAGLARAVENIASGDSSFETCRVDEAAVRDQALQPQNTSVGVNHWARAVLELMNQLMHVPVYGAFECINAQHLRFGPAA
jgi:hypothetical protein